MPIPQSLALEAHSQPLQTHALCSGAHYATADEWIYRNPKFIQIFGKASNYFKTNQPISQNLLKALK